MHVPEDQLIGRPLYHGTSTLFTQSIPRTGLGGRNPIQELDVVGFLRKIIDVCDLNFGDDPKWLSERRLCADIYDQSSSKGNWRYGGTYLTPSRFRASLYARNPNGSKLLGFAAAYYEFVRKTVPGVRLSRWNRLIGMLRRRPKPVIVEIASCNPVSLEQKMKATQHRRLPK
jgi:hypothetical protein